MAPFATIYTTNTFTHARLLKTLAAASLNSLSLVIDPTFNYPTTNKEPDFLSKFPHGKIPALETPSGFCLAESTAMAQYVAESGPKKDQLMGRTPEERALIAMWICFSDQTLLADSSPVLVFALGRAEWNITIPSRIEQFTRGLNRLEMHLQQPGRMWLVGDVEGEEGLSMADLSVAGALYWNFKFWLDGEERAKYPGVMGWWERVMEVKGVGEAFGAPVEMCKVRPDLRSPEEKEKDKAEKGESAGDGEVKK
ncbi:glutathione S-transferase [Amniculicola lignicola CBS 123094]|uniref:Glutathione S-transferase n=1 Tax=Amniculicola lignicola CBS 123094 TaxID=1392246 RepID=A0A6A5WHV0_9PLEO|nr:glutathione S-transferase [Amniculicola lignicola CBS 123094]